MEAKLASLQSRKPADESYVPGQGIDSKYNAPRRADSTSRDASASASPAPEVDLDEEMGLDAAEKAADELEREFGLEIAGRQRSEELSDRAASASAEPERGKGQADKKEQGLTELEKARQEAFKKGLAGLPKKPSFL